MSSSSLENNITFIVNQGCAYEARVVPTPEYLELKEKMLSLTFKPDVIIKVTIDAINRGCPAGVSGNKKQDEASGRAIIPAGALRTIIQFKFHFGPEFITEFKSQMSKNKLSSEYETCNVFNHTHTTEQTLYVIIHNDDLKANLENLLAVFKLF